MSEAHSRSAWNHTASMIATLINVNRGKKGRPVKVKDIHPHESKDPLPLSIADARRIFTGSKHDG
ncbi:MAG: hypothetical protein GVY28_12490 [Alphaproteobacteria bacterium]|jgi:hypothetical protein|nr:hypothetical protein [Alphaproteobacteria bacterium]